eukprot:scaffold1239_cov175-Pinguiococcus_pyrenoidosus.AAC.57
MHSRCLSPCLGSRAAESERLSRSGAAEVAAVRESGWLMMCCPQMSGLEEDQEKANNDALAYGANQQVDPAHDRSAGRPCWY